MNEEAAARLAERATHLTAIKNSPSWPTVRELINAKIERELRTFLAASDVDDAKLHYGRGRLQGMRIMLLMVEKGEEE